MTASWGPQRSGRVAQRAHPQMRKRATEVATTQMGRMGAEDPAGISGLTSGLAGADQAVPVRVPQLSIAPLRMQLGTSLSVRCLDQRGQVGGELGLNLHVAHPVLEIPV